MSLLLKVQQEHSIDFKIDFSIFPNQKTYLSELLPYDPVTKNKKELQTGLREYQMLLNISLEAIKAFKAKDLEKFDSLVGENACQIRAVKIALLATNNLYFIELEESIIKKLAIIEQLLEPKKIASLMLSEISLNTLIVKQNLQLITTSDELFIILSYLLSEAKDVHQDEKETVSLYRNESTAPKKLKKFGMISSTFAYNLVRKARKLLSISSVNFVQDIAMNGNEESLKKMTSPEFTKKHLNCFCIPMFWAYKTLLSTIHKEKIPIIFHAKFVTVSAVENYTVIDEEYLFFNPQDNFDNNFVEMDGSDIDPNRPAFIVQGIVLTNQNEQFSKNNWKDLITSSSISNIILAGAADHRQYPDEMILSMRNKEYENYKKFAKQNGFSFENPSTFFIQHVYPALAGNFLKAI